MAENSSIGGLWKKEKNGKKYYSGQIEIDGVKHTVLADELKRAIDNAQNAHSF